MPAIHRMLAFVHAWAVTTWHRRGDESGQTSAEYALVLLGAGAVAVLIVAWATKTNRIGKLLDAVFGQLTKQVKG